jgi:hypothetical protein
MVVNKISKNNALAHAQGATISRQDIDVAGFWRD